MKKISDKRLAKNGGKMYSTFSAPKKRLPKSNPRQSAKRKAGYRKMLAGKEYKAAKAEAMRRAGDQCEYLAPIQHPLKPRKTLGMARCAETSELHAHHLRYPKTRALEGRDLLIVCKAHHEWLESQKPHKQRMAS